uniref:ZIP family transporter n=2 Tax=Dunaliella tertiolecta TaxID=3047 RepID=A0A7S3QRR3_DUNTE|mmetsp:Transcript_12935/g.35231  ORF Transcript_12935/g.35231 Transcript_12935/m.35231 type:complete len:403 (+) Transcript_12935:151-1359(+)|eukprot:CAMPEP_0202410090 /NCGR_PEP_ID=MMETSP1128-20130828/18346_1 /ASSEMBLY_ACC=CAM_ASM_000463 /TAXON_ID=3047 /ORGANISM="Dunaliella tertiolecta, Strain CCMP1320" /LENGTH=402 /DNA_ID=CAMNT_0049015539 /DNA_START=71 /DNA_END=1279 /DNA_ORIENTATION=+
MEPRFWFDAFSALLLLAVAVLGAWLPRYLAQRGTSSPLPGYSTNTSSKLYHLGNCLSGGVMLSAGFCHLLADALPSLGFVGRFPLATFLAALGMLLTLSADQVVQAVTESAARAAAATSSGENSDAEGTELARHKFMDKQGLLPEEHSESVGLSSGHTKLEVRNGEQQRRSPYRSSSRNSHHSHDPEDHIDFAPLLSAGARPQALNGLHLHHDALHVHDQISPKGEGHTLVHKGGAGHDCSSGPHIDVLFGDGAKVLSFPTTVLLAGALCVHSVLEGMALGAQQTMTDTEDIMIAIAAHKGLAAYALGSSVVESKASAKRFWSVILAFSLASPVGIFIGYALSSVSNSKGGAALSALASGTFLYVAMMEVIPRELDDPHMRMPKMLTICVGFGLMSLLAIWA